METTLIKDQNRKRNARFVLFGLLILALFASAGCRASSSPMAGNGGLDALLDGSGYVTIAAGDFVMGSPNQRVKSSQASGAEANERPQRCVFINQAFE